MKHANSDEFLKGCRILLIGAAGQVGIAIQQIIPPGVQLLSLNRCSLDITDQHAVTKMVRQFRPDWVINAAAYTSVDNAESEFELAFAINKDGAANIARAVEVANARMIHISTDFVFDGNQTRPYLPDDPVNPVNVYGESKLAGEFVTQEILGNDLLILRTAWVYAPHGYNFLMTMIRLLKERDKVNVVEDQIGTPTSAYSLARTILSAVSNEVTGIHHWTDAGVASWYDFAISIETLIMKSRPTGNISVVNPIPTTKYPTAARRPVCTLLDKQSMRIAINDSGIHWRLELDKVISQLQNYSN